MDFDRVNPRVTFSNRFFLTVFLSKGCRKGREKTSEDYAQ